MHLDDVARYNKERWEALAYACVPYSRPLLELDAGSARALVDPFGWIGRFAGKDVLCLAGGGGQQSAAFGLLGSNVTVLDLSDTQLERDREAAAHYGLTIRTEQGDMRDLGRFADRSFDVVWHAHSVTFIPDLQQVYDEVARVLRPGGIYHMSCNNPYSAGLDERDWNGEAYPLKRPYVDGELHFADDHWEIRRDDGTIARVRGPREFRHTMSTLINGMVKRGFVLLTFWEDTAEDPDAEPGTWDHLKSIAPPFIGFWACYRPDVLQQIRSSSQK
jgi:SAM-dependent methyltransferase